MKPAVVLRCPICDAVRALGGRRNEYSKQKLSSQAETHLRGHDLDEPKVAIRKYGIVSDATEIVVPSESHRRLPTKEWTGRDDTWLPDGALSGGERSQSASTSSVEVSSL
ncbi:MULTISPECIES: hypothetical protein [Halorubrum]|jgi:hypothetical protein|uniref:Uncharacterized protein n=1 Tax=Halorubrum tropicale TaxID=1765655 RepID=A0A0M9ATT5_9EURY|nr:MULTISPECIES: hypothetical protein [Halorubrum]KOX97685.1 hypothetical protein AMR74_01950 [Halorubrum tropicale]RLM50869.1 hypothetical protein DVK06_08190 [Halorubrum sp. Atlit-28R]TKX43485.1 hypothetical protein EXE50_09930 [Halorubrum sp. ARQ200]TKX50694.1 hypothetical protein EXE49_06375 [Halorubrum sp. ASP121]TKX62111.1 hypothetical protein EXE48_05440 [Halorubrum sp. ASP1]